jgi:hypothetical protein
LFRGFRKGLGKAVVSWHNFVIETQLKPRKGGLSDDRVYPRIVQIYSPFFTPCGVGVHSRAGIE